MLDLLRAYFLDKLNLTLLIVVNLTASRYQLTNISLKKQFFLFTVEPLTEWTKDCSKATGNCIHAWELTSLYLCLKVGECGSNEG